MKRIILFNEIHLCIEELAYFLARDISESNDRLVTYDDSFLRDLIDYYNCADDEKYIIASLREKIEKELFVKGVYLKSIFIIKNRVYFKK